jgi:hypothetical protein
LPLALYNHAAAGLWFYSPGIYLLLWSKDFPGFRASTSYIHPTIIEAALTYPRSVLQKLATGPLYAVSRFLEASQAPWLSTLVAFGILANYAPNQAASQLRGIAVLIAAPVLLVNIVVSYGDMRYLQPIFPLLVPVAACYLWKFLDDNGTFWRARAWLLWVAGALLFLSPAALQIKDDAKTRTEREALARERSRLGAFVNSLTGEGEVIYTDDPPTIVWEADRAALSLTATPEDAQRAFRHLPPDVLLMTSLRLHSEDYDQSWREAFLSRNPVMGFKPCAEFRTPHIRALLYRRSGACRNLVRQAGTVPKENGWVLGLTQLSAPCTAPEENCWALGLPAEV